MGPATQGRRKKKKKQKTQAWAQVPEEKPPLSLNSLRRERAGLAANPTTSAENQLEERPWSKH